jgi:hypothetical protein|tara:strand:- start:185 stop:622 length:438 start_codon:yes stop_codon:yes gene_type:complete
MTFSKIRYADLKGKGKQQEIYNFQKVSAVLADYGFCTIKLNDDWKGADFLADHFSKSITLRVQLKSRFSIAKKYSNKQIYMCFPIFDRWCLVPHDYLITLVDETSPYLSSKPWREKGEYHSEKGNQKLRTLLEPHMLVGDWDPYL